MLNDEVLRVGGRGVMVLDFTVWGWVHIVIGLVMMLIAYSLYSCAAGWAAVATAAINAIAQVVALTTFPLWGLMAVALDVIVIYQLTARWND